MSQSKSAVLWLTNSSGRTTNGKSAWVGDPRYSRLGRRRYPVLVLYFWAVCSGFCTLGVGGLTCAFKKSVRSSMSCLVPTMGGMKWW